MAQRARGRLAAEEREQGRRHLRINIIKPDGVAGLDAEKRERGSWQLKWNLAMATFFLAAWALAITFIIYPDFSPIPADHAFAISLACFPIFAFYASKYDEPRVAPFCYVPGIMAFAKRSLKSDGPVLFAGRLSVLAFMSLLVWAAVLLAFLNAEAAANDAAVYAYYFLVLGVSLIALSNFGRKEVSLGGEVVERSALDLRLASAFRSLKTLVGSATQRWKEGAYEGGELDAREVLRRIDELRTMLEKMSLVYDSKLEEIGKRLEKIEERLKEKNG